MVSTASIRTAYRGSVVGPRSTACEAGHHQARRRFIFFSACCTIFHFRDVVVDGHENLCDQPRRWMRGKRSREALCTYVSPVSPVEG